MIVQIFSVTIIVGLVGFIVWTLMKESNLKLNPPVSKSATASAPAISPQESAATTVPALVLPGQPALDQPPVVNEQVALPPQPPPSILAFLENHLHPEEMKLLREMNCFSVVNMEEHNDRANNLAPSMMARITMMQRRQDSLLLDVAIIKQRLSMTHQDSIEFIRDFMRNNPQYFTDKKNKKKKK